VHKARNVCADGTFNILTNFVASAFHSYTEGNGTVCVSYHFIWIEITLQNVTCVLCKLQGTDSIQFARISVLYMCTCAGGWYISDGSELSFTFPNT
jgi:hypothetical protein